jgi:hypothetical protein
VGAQTFISYASADKAIADRVCSALEQAGVSCWIAPRDIEPGADYPAAILGGIQATSVMVLILTDQAMASPHILSEVGHAFNGKKRIVPMRLSNTPLTGDLEYFLSIAQWLDAHDGATDNNLKRLTQSVQDALARRPLAHPTSAATPRVAAFAALIAILMIGGAALTYRKFARSSPPNLPLTSSTTVTSTPPPTISREPISAPPEVAIPPVAPPPVRRKTWVNPADRLEYVRIAPGKFSMGCSAADSECKDDEKPTHPVNISKGFWLGRTEVTTAAYKPFAAKNGLEVPAAADNIPASDVTWAEAKKFCEANGGRLPTEAEWEYAARGGDPNAYYGVVQDIAWYEKNSGGRPHAVKTREPNAFDLYDMLGNVGEWVLDRYFNRYDLEAPAIGAEVEQPLAGNASATARGGYWESTVARIRVSARMQRAPDQTGGVGFRCANDHP